MRISTRKSKLNYQRQSKQIYRTYFNRERECMCLFVSFRSLRLFVCLFALNVSLMLTIKKSAGLLPQIFAVVTTIPHCSSRECCGKFIQYTHTHTRVVYRIFVHFSLLFIVCACVHKMNEKTPHDKYFGVLAAEQTRKIARHKLFNCAVLFKRDQNLINTFA